MKLSQEDLARLASWKEGELGQPDTSRPNDTRPGQPILPRVCLDVVGRLARAGKHKTARAQLRAVKRAIDLVLAALDEIAKNQEAP